MAASLRLHLPFPLNLNSGSPVPRLRRYAAPPRSPAFLKLSQSLRLSGYPPRSRRGLGFLAGAVENGVEDSTDVDAIDDARGTSTLPDRFRYLTKEAPDRPVRWPWIIAVVFLAYAWRTVLWELSNWKKGIFAIFRFFGYLSKLALAFTFRYIGDPLTGLIRCIEYSLYSVRYTYASIVAFAPVPELTRIILFSSTVLAIAESTVPDAAESQPYLLTLAGITGYGVINGFIPELLFWLLIAGFFCYSRFVKKRDGISAALPSAAVLAAIGNPWVRVLTIGSYLALAIAQNSKSLEGSERRESSGNRRRLPLPLLLVALSIAIHVAAKWVRRRHLTWMIV